MDNEVLMLSAVALIAVAGMLLGNGAAGAYGVATGVNPAWYELGEAVGEYCINADHETQSDWSQCCSLVCEDKCTQPDCQQHCKWSCRNELKKEFSLYYTK